MLPFTVSAGYIGVPLHYHIPEVLRILQILCCIYYLTPDGLAMTGKIAV